MKAYLKLYQDTWPQVQDPADHKHEVGDNTDNCANCRLASAMDAFSSWELAVWRWYNETVTDFAMEAGIVAELFKDLQLGKLRGLFLRGLSTIRNGLAVIHAQMQTQAQEAAANGR